MVNDDETWKNRGRGRQIDRGRTTVGKIVMGKIMAPPGYCGTSLQPRARRHVPAAPLAAGRLREARGFWARIPRRAGKWRNQPMDPLAKICYRILLNRDEAAAAPGHGRFAAMARKPIFGN
jgi:hypothetical protein